MDISELTAYAEEKYHIGEQFRRRTFSGGGELRITELRNPYTGKPVAVLLRRFTSKRTELLI